MPGRCLVPEIPKMVFSPGGAWFAGIGTPWGVGTAVPIPSAPKGALGKGSGAAMG